MPGQQGPDITVINQRGGLAITAASVLRRVGLVQPMSQSGAICRRSHAEIISSDNLWPLDFMKTAPQTQLDPDPFLADQHKGGISG